MWLRLELERLSMASSVEDYEALLSWNCSPTSPSRTKLSAAE
ncbi:Mobile element protein [Pseudomonas chlororaphis]|uniref:Mobile element protein n=1 Tax=Pseudomonas chlororaphis TaxID=587753 RepID=A0A3G7TYD5_9PSED|nr:Mobile element protein [Pseudomonas chlororaphis]